MPKIKLQKKKVKRAKKAKMIGPMTKQQYDALNQTKNKVPTRQSAPKSQKMALHKTVCSITDPFCIHAKSAPYPDGQSGGTVAYQIRALNTIPTLANGGAICYWGANLPFGQLTSITFGGNYTLNASFSTVGGNISDFSAYAENYRVVSWGVIIRNTLPATTAQGSVIVSKLNSMPALSAVIPPGVILGSEVEVLPLCAGAEYPIIARPLGNKSRSFEAQTTNLQENNTWEVIKVEVLNSVASSSGVITVECFYNVEFNLTSIYQGLNQFLVSSKPQNLPAIAAATKIQNTAPTIFSQGLTAASNKIASMASSALEDILTDSMAFLGL